MKILDKLLSVLRKDRIFETTKITISRSHLSKGELDIHMRYPFYEPNYVIEEIKTISKSIENLGTIYLQGITSIRQNENEKVNLEGVFRISFSIKTCELHVTTYADLWVPVDLNGKLQIENSELNALSLKNALNRIKDELGYTNVYPTDDEPIWDGQLGQKGFDLYIHEDVTQRDDFPKEKHDAVQKYLWQNLNS